MPKTPMLKNFAIEGGRTLGPDYLGSVAVLVQTIGRMGGQVHTGCCVGLDELVITAAVEARLQRQLTIHCQYSADGAGIFGLSCYQAVTLAARSGAQVHYLAGGPIHLPLKARLARRAAAVVAAAQALILYHPGPGSVAAALPAAIKQRKPIFCFAPEAPAVVAGWLQVELAGLPCWCHTPAAAQPALI